MTRQLNVTFIITELRASLFIEQCLLGYMKHVLFIYSNVEVQKISQLRARNTPAIILENPQLVINVIVSLPLALLVCGSNTYSTYPLVFTVHN